MKTLEKRPGNRRRADLRAWMFSAAPAEGPLPTTAGITLIEILVAVSLLGLLSVGIVTALQVAAGSWESARSRLRLDRRIASANAILHAEFSGIVAVQAEVPPQRPVPLRRFTFFQGEPQSMRFVSSYSLTGGRRRGLQIVELQISDSNGGRRVLLNESPYRGPLSAGALVEGFSQDPGRTRGRLLFQPIRPRATSLIIMDELRECSFSYLKPPLQRGDPTVWTSFWDEPLQLPEAIRINVTPASQDARLLPVSIVAAVPAQSLTR